MEEDNGSDSVQEMDEPFQFNFKSLIIVAISAIIISSILTSLIESHMRTENAAKTNTLNNTQSYNISI